MAREITDVMLAAETAQQFKKVKLSVDRTEAESQSYGWKVRKEIIGTRFRIEGWHTNEPDPGHEFCTVCKAAGKIEKPAVEATKDTPAKPAFVVVCGPCKGTGQVAVKGGAAQQEKDATQKELTDLRAQVATLKRSLAEAKEQAQITALENEKPATGDTLRKVTEALEE